MDLEVSASTGFGARIAILSQLLGALVLLPSTGLGLDATDPVVPGSAALVGVLAGDIDVTRAEGPCLTGGGFMSSGSARASSSWV